MQVLITADTIGGVWTYTIDLMRSLEGRGYEFILATMGKPLTDAQRAEVESLPHVLLYESDFALEWMENPWNEVDEAEEWLVRIYHCHHPDVVHFNHFSHGHLELGVPKLVVGHSCVFSWWKAVHGALPPAEWEEYRERVTRGLQGADVVAAPTKAILSELQAVYGPFYKQKVMPNGRDSAPFAPGCKEDTVFSMGRLWDKAKNVSLLDGIANELPWPVRVAGSTKNPGTGSTVTTSSVHLLGKLSSHEVAQELAAAGIYALPARYEPFGLSALEAAFSGCALVLSDIPTLREVWGDAALFADPDQPEAWKKQLLRLMENPQLREEYARKATTQAKQYTLEAMADRYDSLYSQLPERKPMITRKAFSTL